LTNIYIFFLSKLNYLDIFPSMAKIYRRLIQLPDLNKYSCFLWGPRRTGKSFLLQQLFPNAPLVDLLQTETFFDYSTRPSLLRERFGHATADASSSPILIDEIQKCPPLLDEVHWLIENRGAKFLLTGSSARKLRQVHANLLAGRALRREIRPLCIHEINSEKISLERAAVTGMLPAHFESEDYKDLLRSYIADYLKEEIAQEARVTNLPMFSDFLRIAAITSGDLLNYTNISREVGVSTKGIRSYFQILEDTLLGFRIQPFRKRANRRLVETEKFFLFDIGVSNFLAKRAPSFGTPEFGKSFEHLMLMELLAFKSYQEPDLDITFWRTSNKQEVDFILGDSEVAIEVKSAHKINDAELKHLSVYAEEVSVKRRLVVCGEPMKRVVKDKFGTIEIYPWSLFVQELWGKEIV
jgi:uncharacterized protein